MEGTGWGGELEMREDGQGQLHARPSPVMDDRTTSPLVHVENQVRAGQREPGSRGGRSKGARPPERRSRASRRRDGESGAEGWHRAAWGGDGPAGMFPDEGALPALSSRCIKHGGVFDAGGAHRLRSLASGHRITPFARACWMSRSSRISRGILLAYMRTARGRHARRRAGVTLEGRGMTRVQRDGVLRRSPGWPDGAPPRRPI